MAPTENLSVNRQQLTHMYRQMALIRRLEELAAKAYTLQKIKGFCHLYIGMEAVAVGTAEAITNDDYMVTAYREHGQYIAKGGSPDGMMAELFGKETGCTKGVGGSMHLSNKDINFFGGYGIVGGHIPLAVGAAFASKYREDGRVAVCFFGDGAAQQGAFFESLALAQLWKLPVVFLCENNFYAMGTSLERQSYLTDMSARADGLGMKRWQFRGFDVLEVFDNVTKAVEHARSGQGPVMLEAITYRYRGHSMSDPAKYRKPGELEEKKKEDSIDLAAERLKDAFGVTDEELNEIQASVEAEAQAAYTFADESPIPNMEDLYKYVFAEEAE